jgi:hypothetical protein
MLFFNIVPLIMEFTRCALCPINRNLIFTSTSRDDRRGQEMARFDLTQLTSCSLAQMPSDALQGVNTMTRRKMLRKDNV